MWVRIPKQFTHSRVRLLLLVIKLRSCRKYKKYKDAVETGYFATIVGAGQYGVS
jgi:hypothetical protein